MTNTSSHPFFCSNHHLFEIVTPNISKFYLLPLVSNLISDYISIAKIVHFFKTTYQKKFNTVHNLNTFSIVFTNKNSMDRFPPSQSKIRKMNPPINQCLLWMFVLYKDLKTTNNWTFFTFRSFLLRMPLWKKRTKTLVFLLSEHFEICFWKSPMNERVKMIWGKSCETHGTYIS